MSDIVNFEPIKVDDETYEPAFDAPIDMRPDLSALGLLEHEKGIVDDTFENRQVLRANKFRWDTVYSSTGQPTGMIAGRSEDQQRERRTISMGLKTPLLVDPSSLNSDYLSGLDLLIDDDAIKITPPWVLSATRKYREEQNKGGPSSPNRAPLGLPARCRTVKTDGLRCMLWHSGRLKDDGLCRMHLKSQRKPGEDIERARRKLVQSAPYAVDVLEELMESAVSEPVRLKATTEILDRAGIRGGTELDVGLEITDGRTPGIIIAERLKRLADGVKSAARILGENEEDIVDAEVVTGEDEEVIVKSDPPPEKLQSDGKRSKESMPKLETGEDSGFDEHSVQTDSNLGEL
jgi:hypothetical protein